MASAGQRNLSKKNICDITRQLALASASYRLPAQFIEKEYLRYYSSASAGQRWLAQLIEKEYLRHYSSASDGQRNLSKKNICDITPQLAMASDNQRWPVQFVEKEYLRYYSSAGAAALAMYLKYYIVIVNAGQGNLKSSVNFT